MNKSRCVSTWALLVLLSCGCAFEKDFARDATLYNKTVERVGNELLLLNILRAKERRPMYFTSFTQIRGNRSGSLSTKAAFPFGGGDGNSYTGDFAGSISSNPSFELAVLDSQKFISGITTPISSELLKYYWDQGWPKEMLLYLCVREIRITKDEETKIYLNNVWNNTYEDFQNIVRLVGLNYKMEEKTSNSVRWPSFTRDQLSIKDLINIKKAGLMIVPPDDVNLYLPKEEGDKRWLVEWIVSDGQAVAVGDPLMKYRRTKTESFFELKAEIDGIFRLNSDFVPKAGTPKPVDLGDGTRIGRIVYDFNKVKLMKQSSYIQFVASKATSNAGKNLSDADNKQLEAATALLTEDGDFGFDVDSKATMFLRSPEAMLYYLGELVRSYHSLEESESKTLDELPMVKSGTDNEHPENWHLIVVERVETRPSGQPVIEATLDDKRYFIMPSGGKKNQSGRTLHCLAFVSQMLGLHKSADELPTTQSVTVVGR